MGSDLENTSGAHHACGLASIVAAVTSLGACLALPVMAGEESPRATTRTFELRVERRRVPPAQRVLRATEGERLDLRWTADEPLVLHLHGYDIETRVEPGKPAVTTFTARLTGRFPVAIHAAGAQGRAGSSARESGHHHTTLLHVEVHPR